MSSVLSSKIRTNAAIAYFFLGFLFLLAKKQPNFSHAFIQAHAQFATKIHAGFLLAYFVYAQFFRGFLLFSFPVVLISADQIVSVCFFLSLTFLLVWFAYQAQKGHLPHVSAGIALQNHFAVQSQDTQFLNESEKMMVLLSFVPFFGFLVSARHKNAFTQIGERICGIATLCFIGGMVFNASNTQYMLLMLGYIVFLVYVGMFLFLHSSFLLPGFIQKIPTISQIHIFFRTFPLYMFDILAVIFGKTQTVSFQSRFLAMQTSLLQHQEQINRMVTPSKSFLPNWLIAVPIFNMAFLPQLFRTNQQHTQIISQGILQSVLLMVVWCLYTFGSTLQGVFLLPAFLILANVGTNPGFAVPALFELLQAIQAVANLFYKHSHTIKQAKEKEASVHFTIKTK